MTLSTTTAWHTLEGQTARYRCQSVAACDIHLRQMIDRMATCTTPQEMAGLLWDRDLLLERRSALTR